MKEQKERIEKLLERYFDALATDAEEQELRAYFRTADKVDADLLYARTMFCGMDTLAAERLPGVGDASQPAAPQHPAEKLSAEPRPVVPPSGCESGCGTGPQPGIATVAASDAVCETLPVGEGTPAGRQSMSRHRVLRLWGMAAAAVVAFGLLLCVEYMRRPYCYIDGVAVYDKDAAMQATVYLQGFSEFTDPAHMVDELIMND